MLILNTKYKHNNKNMILNYHSKSSYAWFDNSVFLLYKVSASNWGTLITGMTPAEAGIQANYWIPEYGRPKSISQRSHFEPISGEGVPESIFDVMYKQKDMKVKFY